MSIKNYLCRKFYVVTNELFVQALYPDVYSVYFTMYCKINSIRWS